MQDSVYYEGLDRPRSRFDVVDEYCRGVHVLDIGCINHNIDNTAAVGWLHEHIKKTAKEVVGIDYLEDEIACLNRKGYKIYHADITRPVAINDKFDIIIVGNLIEHLSNFEGLWNNLEKLLADRGKILISTANPFYIEQYFYAAFKNRILINPEHTCWIDPVALDQLAGRFGFRTSRVCWIAEKWHLSQVICNSNTKKFDMLTGLWSFQTGQWGWMERAMAKTLKVLFAVYDSKRYAKALAEQGADSLEALLYIKFVSKVFHGFWKLYRSIIVTSGLNKYELYMSVLERDHEHA